MRNPIEHEVIHEMLKAAEPYGLQAEVIYDYVHARMKGDNPDQAAQFALQEWDL